MKIILLVGLPNKGKTTTLKELYTHLTKGLPNPPKPIPIKVNNVTTSDFECVIPYKKKNVAIFSMGDTMHRVYDAIIKYCGIADVLVAAYSTDGTKKMQLVKSVINSKPHDYVNKTPNNTADCQTIISKI